ncbi:MAG: hypothetical protein IPO70_06770 [Bacteroidetes bacterium]|nr:hypothetical protein [Bacteroidota bacterium]
MATIKFIIRSKSDSSSIYVRLKEGRAIDITAKTKYIVNSEYWSATKGQPKNLILAANKKLNQNLEKLKSDLLEHYNNSVDNKTIDTQWLKDFINPPLHVGSIPTKLVEYFEYYKLPKKVLLKSQQAKN